MNKRHIANVSVIVDDYDQAINYYRDKLGFKLVEDTAIGGDKRFVRMSPGDTGPCILLAVAGNDQQKSFVGNQTGDRVFLFLHTDDFWRDYKYLQQVGVELTEEPRHEVYGTVVVFRDLYGNLWDLVEPVNPAAVSKQEVLQHSLPELTWLSGTFTIHRLAPEVPVPLELLTGEFFSVTKTADELSIVCEQSISMGAPAHSEGWRCLKVIGPLDFSLTGILAKLSKVLADAEISIFALSTFDTDYILVKTESADHADMELVKAGYAIIA